jgi:superfamily II DNA helicase RecQ
MSFVLEKLEVHLARKVTRVKFTLDARGITSLPKEEIVAILRGADNLIMSGGRTMLAKVLKGSRDKKVLELKLDNSPVYGYYGTLDKEQILTKIDWVILAGFMRLEYDYRLPLLVYTAKGWEIEKDTYSDELLRGFDEMLERSTGAFHMHYLKDKNRGLILMLLDKIEASGNIRYIPLLEEWAQIDYKKVRQRIRQVILKLEFSSNKGGKAST